MKKIMILAFIAMSQLLSAQEVTKNLGDFTELKVFDQIDVTLVKSNENKIVVKGSRAGDVEIVTKNNELKVRMKLTKLLQGEEVSATIYYKTINSIEASEGSYVGSSDTFKGGNFELNAKEGANIKVNLDVKTATTKAHSGGIVELTGSANNHDIIITSGGIVKARNFETSTTNVTVNAGGEAEVRATQLVDAKTRAGGNINIYGKPKQINEKTAIGGSIKQIE
jgi:hypothetical protein